MIRNNIDFKINRCVLFYSVRYLKKILKNVNMFFFSYIYTSLPSTFNNSDIVLDENRYILNIGFYHSKYVSLENDVNKSVTVCRFSYSA